MYHRSNFFKQFGLSEPQYNVLKILKGSYPDSLPISEIQQRMLNISSNTSRLCPRLVEKGYIAKKRILSDKRTVHFIITRARLVLIDSIRPILLKHCEEVIEIHDDEMVQLNGLLEKVASPVFEQIEKERTKK